MEYFREAVIWVEGRHKRELSVGLCQVHPKNDGGFGGTGKWGALERRQGEGTKALPLSLGSKEATSWPQRTDFTLEVRNLLGFLKGCRAEMQSPGLR